MLQLTGVTKRYGTLTALDDISLQIHSGEFFGLLGPNGAGKSTLMSLLAGLRSPDAGALTWNRQPLGPSSQVSRRILGLVPQHIALYEDLSAEQNLNVFGRLYGLRGDTLRTRVTEALQAVQLHERRKHRVSTFSGGMQRRLNLAAALLHQPALLLCDEPTVGVDPQSRNAIFELLQRLNREQGMTIIYSTHYMEEATRLCSRIGIIDHGRILAMGTLDDLLASLPFEEEIHFRATTETAALAPALSPHGVLEQHNGLYRFRPHAQAQLSTFYALVESHGLPGRLFSVERPTLEAVFLHQTGRHLRE